MSESESDQEELMDSQEKSGTKARYVIHLYQVSRKIVLYQVSRKIVLNFEP